jgi:alkanesulfonate monooxygenase SsuD/methylene tetrahydromethanopterin reductase-like flavin-dependent oxidoreductase (luciferase family)
LGRSCKHAPRRAVARLTNIRRWSYREAVKFGHFCLPTYLPQVDGRAAEFMRRFLEFLVESEDLGFDSLWANEHHFDPYGGIVPSPPILLAALAQRTKRVRLGTSVVVLPLHNPLQIAEQLAMVDVLSGGRLEFGVGRGFVVADYEALDIPRVEAQDRLLEGLDLVLQAWSAESASTFRGRFYQYEDLEVWPRPEQRPHPPVWFAVTQSPANFELAGRRAFRLMTVAYRGVAPLAELTRLYRAAWVEAGHPADAWEITSHYQVVVADDGREARRLAQGAVRGYLAAMRHAVDRAKVQEPRREVTEAETQIDHMIDECRIIAGTPDECVELVTRAEDLLGLTQLDCTFYFGGLSFEQAQRSQRLFATEVMPRVRGRTLVKGGVPTDGRHGHA